MSAFVISFVVVGASIAIVTRIVTDELFQPATRRVDQGRGRRWPQTAAPSHRPTPPTAEPVAVRDRPPAQSVAGEHVAALRWWERVRSAVLLTVIIAALGFAAAAVVSLATVLLITFLRNAVG